MSCRFCHVNKKKNCKKEKKMRTDGKERERERESTSPLPALPLLTLMMSDSTSARVLSFALSKSNLKVLYF